MIEFTAQKTIKTIQRGYRGGPLCRYQPFPVCTRTQRVRKYRQVPLLYVA